MLILKTSLCVQKTNLATGKVLKPKSNNMLFVCGDCNPLTIAYNFTLFVFQVVYSRALAAQAIVFFFDDDMVFINGDCDPLTIAYNFTLFVFQGGRLWLHKL